MRIITILFFVLLSPAAWAIGPNGEITDSSELAALPAYCRGTMFTRDVSHDPRSIAEYQAIYGASFIHLHHYCWALNAENYRNKNQGGLGGNILGNIDYVLKNSPLTFSLLPDIYITKSRVLFKMGRDTDALGILSKLIEIKPDYALAYAQLGKYYAHVNDKSKAIRYYEQGLINTNKKNADFFIFQIKKLDDNYKIPITNDPVKTEKSGQNSLPDQTTQEDNNRTSLVQPLSTRVAPDLSTPHDTTIPKPAEDKATKPNPYCRFCP